MTPLWIFIALGAEVLWVAGNLFDKYLLEHYFGEDDDEGGPGALLIFSAYFSVIFVIGIFIIGYDSISFNLLVGLTGLFIGLLNGIWILLYLYAIDNAELSRVVPLFQMIPIFGLLFGFMFLGETILPLQGLAAGIIILGALVLVHSKKSGFLGIDKSTLFLMIGASTIVALTETLFKVLAVDVNYWTAAFWMGSGFALFGMYLYLFVPKLHNEFNALILHKKKNVIGVNSLNELLDNFAELIFLAAIVIGPIALVQSLNAYQPLLILIASVIMTKLIPNYFDEDLSANSLTQKLFAIIIITIGSFILYHTF